MEEENRLQEDKTRKKNWKRWGPYLSERQWATVREDYSRSGDSWSYLPHEKARSQAYRWGEDGLLGITDRECRLCFALALWNGKDPILKERLFGLTEKEGNHGEDVKECYYYLDSTPTHSYMKALYKYPQNAFPYDLLVAENKRRGVYDREFELLETKIFDKNQYFDVFIEYAKKNSDDILIKVTIHNRSSNPALLHLLPTLWFRNTWSWNCEYEGEILKPMIQLRDKNSLAISHETLGNFLFYFEDLPESVLFTDNDTNLEKLYGVENPTPYVKDAFHAFVIDGKKAAINPEHRGTKAAPHYVLSFKGNERRELHFRLVAQEENTQELFGKDFKETFALRQKESDLFYENIIPKACSDEEKNISRQAYAGLLWSKQFYHYVVKEWLEGDPDQPKPPQERKKGRNADWTHLFARDVISMPDKWEYPWFASWDLAFHMIPFAKVDAVFAKQQMVLFLREWYMHPNGQQPAYEFAFSDVNPPVHAWAAWRIYKMTGKKGMRDRSFLESIFQKLLLNFTWWLNRKDLEGKNIFGGGFLGLDNIGVFNRSKLFEEGLVLEQADATAWMAFYCLSMLSMALELSMENPVYEDIASKFFEHFLRVVDAINQCGGNGLWHEEDGFYYDQLKAHNQRTPLKTRSLVGLIPFIAVEILEESKIQKLKGFTKRMQWFLHHRKDLENVISYCRMNQEHGHRLLAIPSKERLMRILRYMFDEKEFLSPYGIRSLSKAHASPYIVSLHGQEHSIQYTPGEGTSYLFGGNSNWRGPIWFPINFLIIEALERYHHFYGDDFLIEFPTGSGKKKHLKEIADDLSSRLCSLFLMNQEKKRPCHGDDLQYSQDPYFSDLILFYEYFHGDTGRGLGANHQTGWTSLVTKLQEDRKKQV